MVLFVLTYIIEFIWRGARRGGAGRSNYLLFLFRDMFSKRLAAHDVFLSRLSCPCTLRAKRLAAYVVFLARLPCPLLYIACEAAGRLGCHAHAHCMRSGWPLM